MVYYTFGMVVFRIILLKLILMFLEYSEGNNFLAINVVGQFGHFTHIGTCT